MFSYNETSKNADKNIWIGLDLTAGFDNKNYYGFYHMYRWKFNGLISGRKRFSMFS